MLATFAQRYAAWLVRHRILVLLLSVVLAGVGGLLASKLPLRADLSSLLPETRRSVTDLRALSKRASSFGRVYVLVEAADPAVRARAAAEVAAQLREVDARLGQDLIGYVAADDGAMYAFVWEHRFLYADLKDLVAARDALKARITDAKLEANPLFIQLDDDEPTGDAAKGDDLDALEQRLDEAKAKATNPPQPVSKDGTLQLITIHTTFSSSAQRPATALLREVDRILKGVGAAHPGVTFGVTGTVTMSRAEHRSVVEGTMLSGILTFVLCAVALLLYYKSGKLVLAILWALIVGVAVTLGVTMLAIGHLNMMSSFMTAIVIGNGINAGLIFASRYLEEVRAGADPEEAIPLTIAGALPGTIAATVTAALAYTSLIVSDFRGFRHFGVIAGLGMTLTWIAAFSVLPALIAVLARRGWIHAGKEPALPRIVRRMIPKRLKPVLIASTLSTGVAIAIVVNYFANDPFTKDWRDLSSSNAEILALRALDAKMVDKLPNTSRFAGASYQLAIGVERRDQVEPLVAKLRALDEGKPDEQKLFLDVRSIDDLLPADQAPKLEVLAEIRALIDGDLAEALTPEEMQDVAELRPPEALRPLTDADLPGDIAWPFTEKDGTRGRLLVVRGARRFKTWNVEDRQAFAAAVRRIDLPAGVRIGGEPLVIADIVETMERDAPMMIGVALAGALLAMIVVLGIRRHALVTIVCGISGVSTMIAVCALVGLKVHFLDLIALPITIGIGIDYAVNLAARDREPGTTRDHLAATAAAVMVCSYTTVVGYGSLLFSANGGIRAFGLASIIGELSSLFTAMILAPALLLYFRRRAGQSDA